MNVLAEDYPGKPLRQAFEQELSAYKAALEKSPEDAAAGAGLAELYIVLWCYGFISFDEASPKAESAVTKAIELSAGSGLAHTVRGLIKMGRWDWQEAENDLRRGIELASDNAGCHHWYALFLAAMKRMDESLGLTKKAMGLEPSPNFQIGLGSIYYFDHDFDKLATCMEDLIVSEPDFAPGYDWLGMAYVQLHRFDESIEVYEKAAELSQGLAEILGGLGHAYGMAGRYEEARSVLDRMNSLAMKYYIPPVQIAFVYAGLGEIEKMFEMLERAFREHSWELIFIAAEPWFDDFHDDPRFISLIKRLDLTAG